MGVVAREKEPGSGEWWVFINHHGKRKSKKVGRDERKALEIARKIEAKLTLGDLKIESHSEDKAPSFKEYAFLWLNEYIRAVRRPSTFERYDEALKKHINPTLGNKLITEITRGEARNLLLKLYNGGLSKSMIRIIHACISGPMAYALDEEIIPANPITGLTKRLHLKVDKEPVEPMTWDESKAFLEVCQRDFSEYYPFFLCTFRTGMRLGELLGLRWSDIDWHGQFLEVKRAYKRKRTGPTKTGKARRVDMSDHLMQTLKGLYRQRSEEALEEGRGEIVESVFHRGGKPMEQNFIRRIFKRILTKAGIRNVKFHSIRHTFASQLLSDGVSPVYVKEQLGHSSIQMTVDIYGRWIPNQNREAINLLDSKRASSAPVRTLYAPAKKGKVQPIEIAPHSAAWCRSRDLNPDRPNAH